jgi:hypothetical protein
MGAMSPIFLVLLVAVAVGFALGGRLRTFGPLHVHWWFLVFGGLALQALPGRNVAGLDAEVVGPVMLVASYVLLLAFITVNRWIPAAAVMAAGLLLNLTVVALNGGMPVSAAAVRSAGGTPASIVAESTAKHHEMTDDDALGMLGDVIAIPQPFGVVLSIGDLLLYAGIGWFVVQVMRGRSRANPRPLAMWFLAYRGKHAPSHWRMPARYRLDRAGAGRSGTEP